MKYVAGVLSLLTLLLPPLCALPARAADAPVVELTYSFELHGQWWGLARRAGIRFGESQVHSDNGYRHASGVLRIMMHKPDADGSIPIEIAEKWENDVSHDVLPALDMRLMADGTVSFDRLQAPTDTEIQLAQFLVPHFLKYPLEVQKPWTIGGHRNEADDMVQLTLLGADAEGNAILNFSQTVKGRYDNYTATGKVKYDASHNVPLNVHCEMRYVGNTGSEDAQIDYALTETKTQK